MVASPYMVNGLPTGGQLAGPVALDGDALSRGEAVAVVPRLQADGTPGELGARKARSRKREQHVNIGNRKIAYLMGLVREGSRHPRVVELTRRVVSRVRDKDEVGEVRAVWAWIKKHVRYVKDPDGMEVIQTANRLLNPREILPPELARRVPPPVRTGDCDEMGAVLAASMLKAIGYPVRLALWRRPDGPWQHIFTLAFCASKKRWLVVDPTEKDRPFGWLPPLGKCTAFKFGGEDTIEDDRVGGVAAHARGGVPVGEFGGFFSSIGKFFKKVGKGVVKVAKKVGAFVKKALPAVASIAANLIPGVGPLIAPVIGGLVNDLVNKGAANEQLDATQQALASGASPLAALRQVGSAGFQQTVGPVLGKVLGKFQAIASALPLPPELLAKIQQFSVDPFAPGGFGVPRTLSQTAAVQQVAAQVARRVASELLPVAVARTPLAPFVLQQALQIARAASASVDPFRDPGAVRKAALRTARSVVRDPLSRFFTAPGSGDAAIRRAENIAIQTVQQQGASVPPVARPLPQIPTAFPQAFPRQAVQQFLRPVVQQVAPAFAVQAARFAPAMAARFFAPAVQPQLQPGVGPAQFVPFFRDQFAQEFDPRIARRAFPPPRALARARGGRAAFPAPRFPGGPAPRAFVTAPFPPSPTVFAPQPQPAPFFPQPTAAEQAALAQARANARAQAQQQHQVQLQLQREALQREAARRAQAEFLRASAPRPASPALFAPGFATSPHVPVGPAPRAFNRPPQRQTFAPGATVFAGGPAPRGAGELGRAPRADLTEIDAGVVSTDLLQRLLNDVEDNVRAETIPSLRAALQKVIASIRTELQRRLLRGRKARGKGLFERTVPVQLNLVDDDLVQRVREQAEDMLKDTDTRLPGRVRKRLVRNIQAANTSLDLGRESRARVSAQLAGVGEALLEVRPQILARTTDRDVRALVSAILDSARTDETITRAASAASAETLQRLADVLREILDSRGGGGVSAELNQAVAVLRLAARSRLVGALGAAVERVVRRGKPRYRLLHERTRAPIRRKGREVIFDTKREAQAEAKRLQAAARRRASRLSGADEDPLGQGIFDLLRQASRVAINPAGALVRLFEQAAPRGRRGRTLRDFARGAGTVFDPAEEIRRQLFRDPRRLTRRDFLRGGHADGSELEADQQLLAGCLGGPCDTQDDVMLDERELAALFPVTF